MSVFDALVKLLKLVSLHQSLYLQDKVSISGFLNQCP